ncbi:MAG: copper chaperone PCu(A)C [Thermodesulfovibrionales bacterium]|nr:copper chaperone PCu(A)C [Thermodesulfovibrionales bacterium]
MLRIFVIVIIISLFSSVNASDIIIEDVSGIFSPKIPDAGAIFMKIKNFGNMDDAIIDARVDIKGVTVELHDVKDGQMYRIDKINLPAKSTVELKKGGLHIMLFKLPIELKEDQEFKLTIILEKAGEITLPVKLKSSRQMHHHSH